MVVELPVRRGGGEGGRRAARGPDAFDVPAQQLVSDPGLRTPEIVDSGLADVGRAVNTVAGALGARADRQQKAAIRFDRRRESVERVRAGREFNDFAGKTFTEFQSTRDFSKRADALEFGSTLRTEFEKFVSDHQGSEESKLRLRERLEVILGAATDRAAVASVVAQDALITQQNAEVISDISGRARTGESPLALIEEGDAHLDAEADSLRPGQEIALKANLRAEVYSATIDGLLGKADVDAAESMLNSDEARKALGADGQRGFANRIDRFRQEEVRQALAPVKGIPRSVFNTLTPDQAARVLGSAPDEQSIKGIPEDVFSALPEVDQRKILGVGKAKDPTVKGIPRDIFDGLTADQQERVLKSEPDEKSIKGIPESVFNGMSDDEKQRVLGTGKSRLLAPEELAAEGFPDGFIVQRGTDGSTKIVHKPEVDAGKRKKKIDNIVGQLTRTRALHGMDDQQILDQATNIVDGNIEIEVVPATGRVRITNVVSGEAREVEITGEAPQAGAATTSPTLFDLARRGNIAGVIPAAQEFAAETIGQIPGVPVAEDVVRDRQQFKLAQNGLIRSLSINPRFPVGEINRIKKEVDIEPRILDSKRALLARMMAIRDSLSIRLENERNAASDVGLPEKTRSAAAQAAKDIGNFLNRLGIPEDFDLDNEAPEGIPDFSTQIGTTKDGKAVWEAPDGKRFVVE